MRILVLIQLLILSLCVQGQQKQLSVNLSRVSSESDSNNVYQVSLKNFSDSIACILHSMFIDLTSNKPIGLPIFDRNVGSIYYRLDYSLKDTIQIVDSRAYSAELILPYQTLTFCISFPKPNKSEDAIFIFNYLFLQDLHYRQFILELRKMTTWYRKYDIIKATLEIPY